MRPVRVNDPAAASGETFDRQLGVTPQRDISDALEKAGRTRQFPGLAVYAGLSRVGRSVRGLMIRGNLPTVRINGDTVTIEINGAEVDHTHAEADIDGLIADLAAKQPLDNELTALAGTTASANKLPYYTSGSTAATTDLTATARSLLDDTSTAAMLATLGAAAASHTHAESDITSLVTDLAAKDAIGSVRKAVYVDPGATTVSRVGLPADPTLTATTSNADDADGPWLNHATAGTTGSASGMVSAFTVCRRDWLPDVTFRVKTPATLSNTRHWIGLFNQSMDASEATTGDHVAAFRYSTAVDSSGKWQTVTNDGGATPTVTDTGISRSADTAYTMRIRCLSGSIEFYIGGVLVATHTTDLPGATTLLGYAVRAIALANNARSIKWNRMVLSFT